MKTDPRIDAYIDRQADFARPILRHLREMVHDACPDCEETLKWSSPHFMYKGEMLAGMAAFKAHATFGFWRGSLVVGEGNEQMSGMGQFGRLTSVDDLPSRGDLEALVQQGDEADRRRREAAARQAQEGALHGAAGHARRARRQRRRRRRRSTPSRRASSANMSNGSPRRSATRPATKRLAQTIEWLAEGKRRNWKYENC